MSVNFDPFPYGSLHLSQLKVCVKRKGSGGGLSQTMGTVLPLMKRTDNKGPVFFKFHGYNVSIENQLILETKQGTVLTRG